MGKVLPKTIKKTARTQIVKVGDRILKVKKSRSAARIGGGVDGQKFGELSRVVRGWKWHCPELNLVTMARLDMEKAILNLAGWGIEVHNCSLDEWHL